MSHLRVLWQLLSIRVRKLSSISRFEELTCLCWQHLVRNWLQESKHKRMGICICVWGAGLYLRGSTYTLTYAEVRGQLQEASLGCYLPYCKILGLLLASSLPSRLGWQLRSTCLLIPSTPSYPALLFFLNRGAEDWTQVLCLYSSHYTNWAISLAQGKDFYMAIRFLGWWVTNGDATHQDSEPSESSL